MWTPLERQVFEYLPTFLEAMGDWHVPVTLQDIVQTTKASEAEVREALRKLGNDGRAVVEYYEELGYYKIKQTGDEDYVKPENLTEYGHPRRSKKPTAETRFEARFEGIAEGRRKDERWVSHGKRTQNQRGRGTGL